MNKDTKSTSCGGGWVCHGAIHVEGCLSGDQLRNAQQIAADVHRELPRDTEVDFAFAEFKRRLGFTK